MAALVNRRSLTAPGPFGDVDGVTVSRPNPRAMTMSWSAQRHEQEAERRTEFPWRATATVLYAVTLAMFAWGGFGRHPEFRAAFFVVPPLLLMVASIARHADRCEPGRHMGRFIWLAFSLKLLATFVRYISTFDYLGGGDSALYHLHGARLVESFRRFDFTVDVQQRVPGTGTIRFLTGLVYLLTGSNIFAGFLVFSFLAFVGMYLFYRAFAVAFPGARGTAYARLLFFWPSLLYWPSSIGKDAWMMLMLGVAALGAAKILAHERHGFALLAVGLTGTLLVRPHVTLAVILALAGAYALRTTRRLPLRTRMRKAAGLMLVLVIAATVGVRTEQFFDIELTSGELTAALDETTRRTTQGGSSFDPARVNSPADYPWAVFTVAFRPMPHEASNIQMTLTSVEGLMLMALMLASLRTVISMPRYSTRLSYLTFAGMYILLFTFVFAALGNFGVLARQRTQMLPFLLVIPALPVLSELLSRDQASSEGPTSVPS